MSRLLAIASVVFCLLGCVTPYGPKGPTGGYTDMKTGAGRHYIGVQGNGFTDEPTLVTYFHRRAIELCQADGFTEYDFDNSVETTTGVAVSRTGVYNVQAHTVNGNVYCKSQKMGANGEVIHVVPAQPQIIIEGSPAERRAAIRAAQKAIPSELDAGTP